MNTLIIKILADSGKALEIKDKLYELLSDSFLHTPIECKDEILITRPKHSRTGLFSEVQFAISRYDYDPMELMLSLNEFGVLLEDISAQSLQKPYKRVFYSTLV